MVLLPTLLRVGPRHSFHPCEQARRRPFLVVHPGVEPGFHAYQACVLTLGPMYHIATKFERLFIRVITFTKSAFSFDLVPTVDLILQLVRSMQCNPYRHLLLVGRGGIEPPTFCLSGRHSHH